jgi:hypothetical protein
MGTQKMFPRCTQRIALQCIGTHTKNGTTLIYKGAAATRPGVGVLKPGEVESCAV